MYEVQTQGRDKLAAERTIEAAQQQRRVLALEMYDAECLENPDIVAFEDWDDGLLVVEVPARDPTSPSRSLSPTPLINRSACRRYLLRMAQREHPHAAVPLVSDQVYRAIHDMVKTRLLLNAQEHPPDKHTIKPR